MAINGEVQNGIAVSVAASYDIPISVSVITRATKFPFIQELTYNGILAWLQQNFLDLDDFYDEMAAYTQGNPVILEPCFGAIASLIPVNADMLKNIYIDPNMGPVGLVFQQLVGFGQSFAVDPSTLNNLTGSQVVSQNT